MGIQFNRKIFCYTELPDGWWELATTTPVKNAFGQTDLNYNAKDIMNVDFKNFVVVTFVEDGKLQYAILPRRKVL